MQQIHSLTWAQAQPLSAWVTAKRGESRGAPTLYPAAGELAQIGTKPETCLNLKQEDESTPHIFKKSLSIKLLIFVGKRIIQICEDL